MKTAVVFYSLDGNCAFVAEEIKTILNADLIQLRTKREKKRGKIGNLFWGGAMVFSKKNPLLKRYEFDPAGYDLIVFGAPVWAGQPAPPFRTFFADTKITGKKAAFFVCHAGGMGNALEKFKSMLTGNEIISEVDFDDPAKKGDREDVKRQIADWVKTFGL